MELVARGTAGDGNIILDCKYMSDSKYPSSSRSPRASDHHNHGAGGYTVSKGTSLLQDAVGCGLCRSLCNGACHSASMN